jgi:hypothetical protein
MRHVNPGVVRGIMITNLIHELNLPHPPRFLTIKMPYSSTSFFGIYLSDIQYRVGQTVNKYGEQDDQEERRQCTYSRRGKCTNR